MSEPTDADGRPPSFPRRIFLNRAVQLVAAAAAGSIATKCDSPIDLKRGRARRQAGTLDITPVYYPEDFTGFDENNAGPAIRAALQRAAPEAAIVELGKYHSKYVFYDDIYVEGDIGYVTLRGASRAINLKSAGGRLIVTTKGILQTLHLSPYDPATIPSNIEGAVSGDSSNWRIDNCEINGFKNYGINTGDNVSNAEITNCYIHHTQHAGVQIGPNCSAVRVANNRIEYNYNNGIDCNGSSNTIENNDCHYNGQTPDTTNNDRCGILIAAVPGVAACNNNVIRYNRCTWNTRAGIYLGIGSMNGNQLIGNTCSFNSQSAGIMVQAQYTNYSNTNIVFTDNVMESNTGFGLLTEGAGQISFSSFLRNTAKNNTAGCGFQSDSTNTCI